MLTYATVEQLAEHVTPADLDKLPDGDAELYIGKATGLVRRATKNDMYDTVPAGTPSDPVLAEAMTVATCIQVRAWIRAGVDPLAGVAGLKPVATAASTNGSSISYDVAAQAAARLRLLTELDDDARDALRAAGLGTAKVDRR